MGTDEIKPTAGDATLTKGQDSPKENESNSQQTPRIYTEAEHKKAVEDAIAQYGDRIKRERIDPIAKELETFKLQVQNKDTDIADNTAEIDRLQARIDDMASNDPERYDANKEFKAAKEERKQLKLERRSLQEKELTYGERIKGVESIEREALIQGLIKDYEGGDLDKLKKISETTAATSEVKIREIADTIGSKRAPVRVPTTPVLNPASSKTLGGGASESKIIRDYADNPNDLSAKKAWIDLMVTRRNRR